MYWYGEGADEGRRRFVAMSATVLAGFTSGCSTVAETMEERARKKKERTPRLCRKILLTNHDTEPHSFTTLIERDGEIMEWWESDEIPPRTGVHVELGSWHWERGQYTIYGTYEQYQDWSVNDYSDRELEEDQACIFPQIRIFADGDIAVITTIKGKNEYITPTPTEDSSWCTLVREQCNSV